MIATAWVWSRRTPSRPNTLMKTWHHACMTLFRDRKSVTMGGKLTVPQRGREMRIRVAAPHKAVAAVRLQSSSRLSFYCTPLSL